MATAPFLGRDADLDLLRQGLATSAKGRGHVTVIQGEAGIGKSRLIEEVVNIVPAGVTVCRAGCQELERSLPFKVVVDALMDADSGACEATTIRDLLHGNSVEERAPLSPDPNEQRYKVLEEIVSLVERETSSHAMLLVFEDLQWADPSSLLAIKTLARRIPSLPVFLVLTARPDPRPREVTTLVGQLLAAGAVSLILSALDPESSARLLAAVSEAAINDRTRQISEAAGGNPLFLVELGSWLSSLGSPRATPPDLATASLPENLTETIRRRLAPMSPRASHLLELASVLGLTFDIRDLQGVAGVPLIDIAGALREATQAGLIDGSGERMTFRHALVQAALYEGLAPAVRRGFHRGVAAALIDLGRPASEVAPHLVRGARPGDGEAVEWLRRAARTAAPRSPSSAAELLRRALTLHDPNDAKADEVAAELVSSLVWAGEAPEAESLAVELLTRVGEETSANLRWALAIACAMQGRLGDALKHTEDAVDDPALNARHRARLLAEASQWRFYTGDIAGADEVARRAIAAGEGCGDPVAIASALCAMSRVAMERCDFGSAVSLGQEAVRAVRGSQEEASETNWIHPTFDLAGALVVADRLDEARSVLGEGRRLRERLGSTWDLPLFTNALAYAYLYRGEWDDAVAEATTVLSMMDEGGAKGSALWALSLLAYIAIHRGDQAAAERAMDGAHQMIDVAGPMMGSDQILWCSALIAETNGDPSRAWSLMLQGWDMKLPFKVVTRSRMGRDAVRMALAVEDEEKARAIISDLDGLAKASRAPLYRGVALQCRALVEAQASTALTAIDALRTSSRPLDLAFACEDAGSLLVREGCVDSGATLLREAIDLYETVGALRDVGRAHSMMRASGLRPGPRGRRPTSRHGWQSLSRTEQRVVDLVERGLTNREIGARLFISRRTVETHVSHIFRKLDVSSRVELAAKATARRAGNAEALN